MVRWVGRREACCRIAQPGPADSGCSTRLSSPSDSGTTTWVCRFRTKRHPRVDREGGSQDAPIAQAAGVFDRDAAVGAGRARALSATPAPHTRPAPRTRPTLRKRPRITGSPRVGQKLRLSSGFWSGVSRFAFPWQMCNLRGRRCRTTVGGRGEGTQDLRADDSRRWAQTTRDRAGQQQARNHISSITSDAEHSSGVK